MSLTHQDVGVVVSYIIVVVSYIMVVVSYIIVVVSYIIVINKIPPQSWFI